MNIYNTETRRILLQRVLISLGIILFIRIGSFLPVPEIDHIELAEYIKKNSTAQNFINGFSYDGTVVIGLFTLNIIPYINASIIIQSITAISPSLSKLQKESNLDSKRSITRLTRFITLICAIIQSVGIALFIRPVLFNWNLLLLLKIVLWLSTGAMIVLWLCELITDYGLGNGASLLIYINILSNVPNIFKTFLTQIIGERSSISILSMIVLIILSLFGTVLLQESIRKIELVSLKQLGLPVSRRSTLGVDPHVPLKLNQAGVMPIILTTAILVVPNYLINAGFNFSIPLINMSFLSSNLEIFSKVLYWLTYCLLILVFSLLYSAIVLNPKDIADRLQKTSASVPDIRSGAPTAFYIREVMRRLSVVGASGLAIIATLPTIMEIILNIPTVTGLNATSLIIVTSVLVDITKEIDDIIYSNIYKKDTIKL